MPFASDKNTLKINFPKLGQWLWHSWQSGRFQHQRGMRFESSHPHHHFLLTVCKKGEYKEAGNGPFKNQLLETFVSSSHFSRKKCFVRFRPSQIFRPDHRFRETIRLRHRDVFQRPDCIRRILETGFASRRRNRILSIRICQSNLLKMCFDRSNFHHIIRARWY